MTYIEEKAYSAMTSILGTISHEEKHHFDGCFAGDMIRVNKKSKVYPLFVGFCPSTITIVTLSKELEKEHTEHILLSQVKEITMKKRFLSKIFTLSIKCLDGTSYIVGVPHSLAYIPVQMENVDLFLKSDFFLKLN